MINCEYKPHYIVYPSFLGKIRFGPPGGKGGQNSPKMNIFAIFSNLGHLFCFILCMINCEYKPHYMVYPFFLGKIRFGLPGEGGLDIANFRKKIFEKIFYLLFFSCVVVLPCEFTPCKFSRGAPMTLSKWRWPCYYSQR